MRYSLVFYFGGCCHRSTVSFNPLKNTKTSCPPKPPACEESHQAYINPCVNCCGVSWIPLHWCESRITQTLTFISADMIFEQYNNNALSTDMEWYDVFVRDRLTRMWHHAVAVSWQDSFSSESVPLKWKEVSHNLRQSIQTRIRGAKNLNRNPWSYSHSTRTFPGNKAKIILIGECDVHRPIRFEFWVTCLELLQIFGV